MEVFFENLFRRLGIWFKKRTKKVVTVKNYTKEKLFVLRREHDFTDKKSIRLKPDQELNIVIESFRGGALIRNIRQSIFTFTKPISEVVINDGEEPGHYDIDDYNFP